MTSLSGPVTITDDQRRVLDRMAVQIALELRDIQEKYMWSASPLRVVMRDE